MFNLNKIQKGINNDFDKVLNHRQEQARKISIQQKHNDDIKASSRKSSQKQFNMYVSVDDLKEAKDSCFKNGQYLTATPEINILVYKDYWVDKSLEHFHNQNGRTYPALTNLGSQCFGITEASAKNIINGNQFHIPLMYSVAINRKITKYQLPYGSYPLSLAKATKDFSLHQNFC